VQGKEKVMDCSALFGKYDGTIVLYNMSSDTYSVYNKARSLKRFTPYSTFKILNSIIALETGVVKDADAVFTWDTVRYPPEHWWPQPWYGRHTMRSAIRFSVVPFYREVATRIGDDRMKKYVDAFGYGNCDISSGIDAFWLNGSLGISAMEQVAFLIRFYRNEPGVKKKTIDTVKSLLVLENENSCSLSVKTGRGWGFLKDAPTMVLGWYIGYVERENDVWFFALNIEGDSMNDIQKLRTDIVMKVLEQRGVIRHT